MDGGGRDVIWHSITSEETLTDAWKRVSANMGGPGVDHIKIADFEANITTNLQVLKTLLNDGSYSPLPMVTKEIEKDSGASRILKIPSVRDRIVQQAFLLVLQPLMDKDFLSCSYGYRPKKSAIMAIKRIEKSLKTGNHWIVDADIESFFDMVDHGILLEMLAQKIPDKRILDIICKWVTDCEKSARGIPQGAVISPLLANIYLHRLDQRMYGGPGCYVRYCDDFLILCNSEAETGKALTLAKNCLEQELLLSLNNNKTRTCHVSGGFAFLGFEFENCRRKAPTGAVERLMMKVETVLQASGHIPDPEVQKKLDAIVRGWMNYFQLDGDDRTILLGKVEQIIRNNGENIPPHILKAALDIQGGHAHKALEVVSEKGDIPTDDPELLTEWAVLWEALNLNSYARQKYSQVLKLSPDHEYSTYRMGMTYLKEEKIDKAIRFLQRAVELSPQSPEPYAALGSAFEKWSLHGAAQKMFNHAQSLDPNFTHKAGDRADIDIFPRGAGTDDPAWSGKDVEPFLRLFSGREGIHARQWVDKTGRQGYSPVLSPITEQDVRDHFEGKITLGAYVMRTDNTVLMSVIDIDVSTKSEFPDRWMETVLQDARKIADVLDGHGVNVYMEFSGWKGMHCWLFFEEPVAAVEARRFLNLVLQAAGPPSMGLHREIFPKQNSVAPASYGCLVKLPLGIHRVSNHRVSFVDSQGRPFEDQMAYLKSVKPVGAELLREAASRLDGGSGGGEHQALVDGDVHNVVDQCRVINFLVAKAKKQRNLRHPERLVLLHTLGHLGEAGRQTLQQVMGVCVNYNRRLTEKWLGRLNDYPMSCPRIRDWLHDITPALGCHCNLPKDRLRYPSPVLYASGFALGLSGTKVAVVSDQVPGPTGEEQQAAPNAKTDKDSGIPYRRETRTANDLVKELIAMRKQKSQIEERLQAAEMSLEMCFENKGTDTVEIDLGKLTRSCREGKTVWLVEL